MKQTPSSNLRTRLLDAINDFVVELLYLIIAMLVIRVSESIALFATGYNSEILLNNLEGLFTDIAYCGKFMLVALITFSALHLISPKSAKTLIRICFSIGICASMLLVAYFASTHIPLDSILLAYSPKELFTTIKANGGHNILIICAIAIISIAFAIIPRRKIIIAKWISATTIAILVASLFFPGLDKEKFRFDKEYYILENKIAYLAKSISSDSTTIQYTDDELKELSVEFESYFPEYQFTNYRFPFMHKRTCKDILGEYLEPCGEKPDIVIIIAEGLCNEVSGANSIATSATPFLDSLSEHSLVWENCLSTSERTFGALPSILGALPFGDKGFMSYRNDVPDFKSLATILHDNGYRNTFFYGGWYGFDDMDIFAGHNHMDNYFSDSKYENIAERSEWGLLDEFIFVHSLEAMKNDKKTPRLNVYLTLSTHDPYDYPNAETYSQKYLDRQKLAPRKKQIKKKINEYASFMYLDDCLKDFIEKYKSLESYKNTIFVITGDHRFITSTNTASVDNFHVPLIIWSPMLKEGKKFTALTTHRNISPTLLAFLGDKCGLSVPETSTVLNFGLDTATEFSANTFSPHFDAGKKLKALTYGEYYITGGKIYKYGSTLGKITLTEVNADPKLLHLTELYTKLEHYIMNNNALTR